MSGKQSAWIRAFIALNLPAGVKAAIESFQRELRAALRNDWVRWTPQEQIHLTLRFLGNIAADSVPELEAALRRACAGFGPFELRAGGFGWFPEGTRPRVLWVGVEGDLDVLKRLVGRVTDETQAWGEREERSFHPHLTIGRVKTNNPRELRELSAALASVKAPAFVAGPESVQGGWRVTQVDLMRSELSPAGAVHTLIAQIQLCDVPSLPLSPGAS